MEYLYLFVNSFISATLFPLGSEALLIYYLSNNLNFIFLLIFASVGNTLGAIVNYWFGLKGEEFIVSKNLIKKEKINSYKRYFNKYGYITLLFSWLPIVGDGFTLIAGILKYNIKKFILFVFIAKSLRYIFIILIFYKIIN